MGNRCSSICTFTSLQSSTQATTHKPGTSAAGTEQWYHRAVPEWISRTGDKECVTGYVWTIGPSVLALFLTSKSVVTCAPYNPKGMNLNMPLWEDVS